MIVMIVFFFGALVLAPRRADDCKRACDPAPVLECGRTILCVLVPAPSVNNPCPGGDCKDGGR
jgi:hypothetical protein